MSETDVLLAPLGSGVSFGSREPCPLAEEVATVLPSPAKAVVGVATSALGTLLARLPAPTPVKVLLIAGPLLILLAEWFRREGKKRHGQENSPS